LIGAAGWSCPTDRGVLECARGTGWDADDRQGNEPWGLGSAGCIEGSMAKATEPQFIESTAGQVAAELARRGVAPGRRVTVTIEPDEPDDWITKVRKFARPKVIAEGWTDDDIDRLIKQAQREVAPRLE
jgi:hypothetical protein